MAVVIIIVGAVKLYRLHSAGETEPVPASPKQSVKKKKA
jgi:hypothetical protein